MRQDYPAAHHATLESGTRCIQPPELPLSVTDDSPAREVMTDFAYVRPVTTTINVPIDAALRHMKDAQVRLLMVVDDDNQVIGLITSNDIQGEKPIKLVQENRVARSEITVGQIMTAQKDIHVIHMLSVLGARVGHIVATLRALEHRHLVVVQHGEELVESLPESASVEPMAVHEWSVIPEVHHEAPSGQQWIRGLFSASQISRQLGVEISVVMAPAHSLAEVVQEG